MKKYLKIVQHVTIFYLIIGCFTTCEREKQYPYEYTDTIEGIIGYVMQWPAPGVEPAIITTERNYVIGGYAEELDNGIIVNDRRFSVGDSIRAHGTISVWLSNDFMLGGSETREKYVILIENIVKL